MKMSSKTKKPTIVKWTPEQENDYSPALTFLVHCLFHSFFIFAALTGVFIFVISSITDDEFNNQIENLTKDVVKNTLTQLDNNNNQSSDSKNTSIKQFILDNQDQLRALYNVSNTSDPVQITNNKWLFITNLLVLMMIFLFLTLFVTFIVFFTNFNVDVKKILKKEAEHIPFLFLADMSIFFFYALSIAPVTTLSISQDALNRAKNNLTVSNMSSSST